MTDDRRPRRPGSLSPATIEALGESTDPIAELHVAHETAAVLLHAGRAADDPAVTDRLVALVEEMHPEVRVLIRAPQGLAQEVLLEEACDAGLLVVGSRGQGGFAGLELGSVSRSLLRHADLPVAVVRDGGI